jgi:hypothetical protein
MNSGQLKICCQKILPKHQNEYNFIQKTKETHSDIYHQKLKAAFYAKKLWPKNAIITIGFISEPQNIIRTEYELNKEIDPLQKIVNNMPIKDAIKKIVNERIQPIINLKLQFIENANDAIVRINFNKDDGAWSLVGTDCQNEKKQPTMNLGWFDVATVIHEFGHVLGMIHEHQNPFGKSIDWNIPAVLKWAQETQGWDKETTMTNIINKYNKTELNGSNFDPNSIMLYFYPPELTLDNKGTQQNLRLSPIDVSWIYKTYPNNTSTDDLNIPTKFYQQIYNSKSNKVYIYLLIIFIAIIIIPIIIFKNKKK